MIMRSLVVVALLLPMLAQAASPGPPPALPGSGGSVSANSVAGLPVAQNPSAAALAAALGLGSASQQQANAFDPAGAASAVAAAAVAKDAAGTISGQLVQASGASVSRSLATRASDQWSARDYGAVGSGTAAAIGTTYGSTLAALAAWSPAVGAAHPFAWAINPAFGLTFTVTTSAAQTIAGALPCIENLNFQPTLPYAMTVACWQDPAHANYLLRPGLTVTGPTSGTGSGCITGTVTVASLPSTPERAGELLPGSTDWAANTTYAVNAVVYSPAGGGFYKVATAGTSGSTGPNGTGTNIADGTVQWSFLKAGETVMLPSGMIALSGNTSATLCPAGTRVTFTIAPAQLQALTTDWLGIQSAMAQAWQQVQGAVAYIPAGHYMLNHPLLNAASETDVFALTGNIVLRGDSFATTSLSFISDAGQDECAISEATMGRGAISSSNYQDFYLRGPATAITKGISPAAMDGLCVGATAVVSRVLAQGFHAGLKLIDDHQTIVDSSFGNNGYGIEMGDGSDTMGNQVIRGGSLDANTVACVMMEPSASLDSADIHATPCGFSPYGFYCKPWSSALTPNVATAAGELVGNTTFHDVQVEAIGVAYAYCPLSNGNFSNNTIIGGGQVGMQAGESISNGQGGVVPSPALYDLNRWDGNQLEGTYTSVYGFVAGPVVQAVTSCSNNLIDGDQPFAVGGAAGVPSAAHPPFSCGSHAFNDTFRSPIGDGTYRMAGNGAPWSASEPIEDYTNGYAGGYGDGAPLLGMAAAGCNPDNTSACLVWTQSPSISGVPVLGNQWITAGSPVFATNLGGSAPGVQQGLDNTGAIGIALSTGAGPISVSLRPMSRAGAAGAQGGVTLSGAAGMASFAQANVNSATVEEMTISTSSGTVVAGQAVIAAGVPVGVTVQATVSSGVYIVSGLFGTVGSEVVTLATPSGSSTVDVTGSSGASAALALGVVPVGAVETVCNDSGGAITTLPPYGQSFQGGAASASVAAGVCSSLRRIAGGWHS